MKATARYPSHLISKSQSEESKGFSVGVASMGRTVEGNVPRVAPLIFSGLSGEADAPFAFVDVALLILASAVELAVSFQALFRGGDRFSDAASASDLSWFGRSCSTAGSALALSFFFAAPAPALVVRVAF